MKNTLILHGAGNNSQGNWFPWLKGELEKKGYQVWSPDMPNADIPDKDSWLKVIFSNKEWHFTDETVMIGHSAGANLILRILEALPDGIQINKAILVSGPENMGTKKEYFGYKGLVKDPFNWEKIKKGAKNFYLVYSDNDQYECGVDQGKLIQEHIGGELILKPGQGHFNLEQGEHYKKFPLITELLDK